MVIYWVHSAQSHHVSARMFGKAIGRIPKHRGEYVLSSDDLELSAIHPEFAERTYGIVWVDKLINFRKANCNFNTINDYNFQLRGCVADAVHQESFSR